MLISVDDEYGENDSSDEKDSNRSERQVGAAISELKNCVLLMKSR